jgi:cell division protein FtsI (penicillin-binding protein 3)
MELGRLRFSWLVKTIAVCFLAIEGRLVYLQVREHPTKVDEADDSYQRSETMLAARGAIYMRGEFPLAESVPAVRLWADSNWTARQRGKVVPGQRDAIVAEIEGALGRKVEGLRAELDKSGYRLIAVEPLERDLATRRVVRGGGEIQALLQSKKAGRLPGITIERTFVRSYPHREMAAAVAGYVDHRGVGQAGIELAFEEELRGKPGSRTSLRDAGQRPIFDVGAGYTPPVGGADVHLTLDSVIQYYLEEALADAVERHRPGWTAGIVLDPRTGAVLAMASTPRFDPNRYSAYDLSTHVNRCVTLTYTPGSCFKPFMMATAMEWSKLSLERDIDCSSVVIDGRRVRDAHLHGKLSPPEIMAESSNVGMVKIMMRLVPESLVDPGAQRAVFARVAGRLDELGFGRRLGISLPAESPGLLAPADRWSRRNTYASLAFGHEIAVTPIQLAAAFAVFANGGIYSEPYVVERVTARDGEVLAQNAPRPRRVFERRTADRVRDMLVSVVDDGTGTKAQLDCYTVAGKTSTAQWESDPSKYSSAFVGFAPARDPHLLVAIVVDQPRKNGHYGGTVAAPAARDVLDRGLAYLRVPYDREPSGG